MKRSLYNDWTRALRTEDYQQCQGSLREGGTHCCLGVLLDIEDPDAWEYRPLHPEDGPIWWWDSLTSAEIPLHRHGLSVLLDTGSSMAHTLANMNDNGSTFADIADQIDEWAVSGLLPLED